jgi:hypothetical protein
VERGEVSWVTLVLLVLVGGAGYLAWVWGPVYAQLYTVKQLVRDHMNQAIKNRDDPALRAEMVRRIRDLDPIEAVDVAGRPVRVPVLRLDERDVVWERDEAARPPTLHVAFAYERDVVYPLVGRTDVRIFEVDLTGDLTMANWGPGR